VRMFFAVITLLIGGGLLIDKYNTITGFADAENWISTPCTIEKSEFIQSDDGGGWLEFSYRYEVNGISYSGDRLDMLPGRMGNDDTWEAQIFKDYPIGTTATCYFDPSNPARSVFDNQHGAGNLPNLLLISLPFLTIGTVFLFSVYWSLFNARAMRQISTSSVVMYWNTSSNTSSKTNSTRE